MADPAGMPRPPQPPGGGDNPFAAPRAAPAAGAGPAGELGRDAGMIRHVMPVAILMIVQGAFELLLGVVLLAAAVMAPMMLPEGLGAGEQTPVPMAWIMAGTYGVMGGGGLVAGLMHVVGGIFGLRFRRRVLGIVALSVGMASLFTCYCGLTAVGLGIYGLVTYLNPAVIAAFALGDAGVPAAEIRARYGG